MSATRPWVDAFAEEMEARLVENREKGGREGWSRESKLWLLSRLQNEVAKLTLALDLLARAPNLPHGEVCCRQIVCEAADVANYAMMLADVAGRMLLRKRGKL